MSVITEDEKSILLDAVELKIASVNRFINAQVAGSPMAKAGYVTKASLDSLKTKVAKL